MIAPTQECVIDSSGIHFCLDCGMEDPKWICGRQGIKVCPECCGVHRSLRADTPDIVPSMEIEESNSADELPSSSDDVVPPLYISHHPKPYIEVEVCGFGKADLYDEDYDPTRPRTILDDAFDELFESNWKIKLPIDDAFYDKFMATPDKDRLDFLNHYYNMNNY